MVGKSTKQKAKELGISDSMVRRKLRQRKITGSKPGGHDWIVTGSGGSKKKKTKTKSRKKKSK